MEQTAELRNLGEEVRKQGYKTGSSSSMKDLVFDPETGTFVAREHSDTPPQTGDIVTGMTEEGFARESRRCAMPNYWMPREHVR